ncbi:MAG: hypothetical protein EHM45_24705, partial [Desulfobacteraceae bacterium]
LKKAKGGTFACAKNSLRLVGLLNLGPRRSVALIEVDEQWLILGVTADRITLLDKRTKPPRDPAAVREPAAGFQALLRQTLFKNASKKREMPESDESKIEKNE